MKVAVICWIAALFFAWLVCGNSFEQVLIASKVLFTGLILGLVGGKVSLIIHAAHLSRTAHRSMQKR